MINKKGLTWSQLLREIYKKSSTRTGHFRKKDPQSICSKKVMPHSFVDFFTACGVTRLAYTIMASVKGYDCKLRTQRGTGERSPWLSLVGGS